MRTHRAPDIAPQPLCRSTQPQEWGTARGLHLLDVENLLAGDVSSRGVQHLWTAYRCGVRIGAEDLIVAAFCPNTAPLGAFELPSRVRILIGNHGPNSADHALLANADPDWVATRFNRLVIASGDGIFTSTANAMTGRGLTVELIRGLSKTAQRLTAAAYTHTTLILHRAHAA